MATMLRVSGEYEILRQSMPGAPFALEESIRSKSLRERNDPRYDGRSTYNFTVSEADGGKVPLQVRETIEFLGKHSEELKRLGELPGVDQLTLDFMWDIPSTSFLQYNDFTLPLLKLCAGLGIEIQVSVYICDNWDKFVDEQRRQKAVKEAADVEDEGE